MPTIIGNVDYLELRQQLERIDELLDTSGVEKDFVERTWKADGPRGNESPLSICSRRQWVESDGIVLIRWIEQDDIIESFWGNKGDSSTSGTDLTRAKLESCRDENGFQGLSPTGSKSMMTVNAARY